MHCEKHPKYKGDRELKQKSRKECSGCQRVRASFLEGFKERKNKGKGSQFSITSPGFRCGITHLLAELGTVILYGKQPAFFWRKNTNVDPRAKNHYKKTYKLLSTRFNKEQDLYKKVSQVLWLAWEDDYHKICRNKEHKKSIEIAEGEEYTAQVENPTSVSGYMSNVHINPLLYDLDEEEDNGEEEKEKERSF